MLDMPLVAEDASWRERLFSMIGARMADWNPISACGAKARCWPTAIRHQSGLPADHEYGMPRPSPSSSRASPAANLLLVIPLLWIAAWWSLRPIEALAREVRELEDHHREMLNPRRRVS